MRAQTSEFWDFVVEMETTGGPLPPAEVPVSKVSKANPAVVTVPTDSISEFLPGDSISIRGVTTTGMTGANGVHTVGTVNTGAGTFTLTGLDLSAGSADAMTADIFVQPAIAPPAVSTVISVSNANPAVVTVPSTEIGKFANGQSVVIAGLLTDMTAGNGAHTIAGVNSVAGTFTLGVNLAAAAAPQTSGITAQAPAPAVTALIWAKICGLTTRTITRAATTTDSEVPDCDDESLPNSVETAVTSQKVSLTGAGVWAAQSSGTLYDWWRSGKSRNVRVGQLRALSGDIKYESGPAILSQYNNTAAKGAKVTGEITIDFNGIPQPTYA